MRRAAAQCSAGEQCCADIYQKLLRWGVTEEDASEVVARLVSDGFVDDARYARAFAHDRIRYHRWGRVKIAYMLRQRGVGGAAIGDALAAIDGEWAEEYAAALGATLAVKRGDRTKAMRYAASHGFTADEIYRAIE